MCLAVDFWRGRVASTATLPRWAGEARLNIVIDAAAAAPRTVALSLY
jgi:hypothetical protein